MRRHRLLHRGLAALGALALGLVPLFSCAPRPQILEPADQASLALDGHTDVRVELGQVIAAPASYRDHAAARHRCAARTGRGSHGQLRSRGLARDRPALARRIWRPGATRSS